MLIPRNTHRQIREFAQLVVVPPPTLKEEITDQFGNLVTLFHFRSKLTRLDVTAISTVTTTTGTGTADILTQTPWKAAVIDLACKTLGASKTHECEMSKPFNQTCSLIAIDAPEINAYVQASLVSTCSIHDFIMDIMHRLHNDMRYAPGLTGVNTSAVEALRAAAGVCQDFAHIAVGCLRSAGLASRYVCGYLATDRPRGAHEPHAWASVFVPDYGWLDFDPTHNCLCDTRYITLAWGRDYNDVSPFQGSVDGDAVHTLEVSIEIDERG